MFYKLQLSIHNLIDGQYKKIQKKYKYMNRISIKKYYLIY
jgi:hypothetical protein